MRVIIAGSRSLRSYHLVQVATKASGFLITQVVCGEAPGADKFGRDWATCEGIPVASFPADWKKYRKRAGFMRNQEMADYADALIALWDGKSNGTADMISRARAKGIPVYVHWFTPKPKQEFL